MQETTFPVEIFVHDDASKDETQAILKEYQEKYPRLFRMVLQKENQWSRKGNKHLFGLVSRLPGDYVAFCEGDDYWVSKNKLQSQIELLEKKKDAAGCYHQSSGRRDGKEEFVYPPAERLKELRLPDVLREISVTTCTLCVRNIKIWDQLSWADGLLMGDRPMVVQLATHGPILPLAGIHAHYRLHPTGLWHGASLLQKKLAEEKFLNRVFRRFKKQIPDDLRLIRKKNLRGVFQAAYAEGRPLLALQALIQYLLARPQPGRVPGHQKRAILYAFTLGALCKPRKVKY